MKEVFTATEIDPVTEWGSMPGLKGVSFRFGDPSALLKRLSKYPTRQLIADSSYFGEADTPEIGPPCLMRAEIIEGAKKHKKSRYLILETNEEGWSYGLSVSIKNFATRSCFTDECFTEVRWSSKENREFALGFLQSFSQSLLETELEGGVK